MPTKKTKPARKGKPAKKAKPDKLDLAEYRRQHPPHVTEDLGEQWLSERAKEEMVLRDRVQRLFSGVDSPDPADLDEAVKPILRRRMFEKNQRKR